MRFVGRGHPAIRATHEKTLELSIDEDITERASCVIAVGTAVEPARPLAGPVRIRISAGAERFSLDAIANPMWDPAGPVVIRGGPLRKLGTFATEADATAADLPRSLVAALADPDQLVTVDVAGRPSDVATLVLFAAAGPSAALDAELAAADLVLALDDRARTLIGPHDARPGRRTLIVATRDVPWRGRHGAERIETVGLVPPLAALAASPGSAPAVFVASSDARAVIRSTSPARRLVVTLPADDLPGLLELAAEVRGCADATLAQLDAPPVASPALLTTREPVAVCLHAVAGESPLDPTVRAAITGLLADGVPTKTAARALAELAGWERRRAYDTVLTWR